ncbi:MAG: stage V sporulation protein AD [Halothermotrichaceae bacterium]
MADKLKGQTLVYENPPHIIEKVTIVGPEESKGPYGNKFDMVCKDPKCGKSSWEKGEKEMVFKAVKKTLKKSSIAANDIDMIIGGDLLDQLITANYVARDFEVPFIGIYGACSTMIEALALGTSFMDGGFADLVMAVASSHYQTAERQYRTPLEYGAQYPPSKQYTVTGAGVYLLGWLGGQTCITQSTFGKVIDLGVKDANNMGGAMAPAAADTIIQNFKDLNRSPQDYDLILTGDLGRIGLKVLKSLLKENNIQTGNKLKDCGALIFGNKKKYGAGGSGCAASAVLFGSIIIPGLISGELNRVMIIGTGALLSPLTIKQNESIPAVAHAVVVERIPGGRN